MYSIDQIIQEIYELPKTSKDLLLQQINQVCLSKGHILFEADKVEKSIYFIQKGIVRAYAYAEGTEVTFWFGQEGQTVLSMRSYVEGKRSYEFIELLEDCVLFELNTHNLQQLFKEDIHIANWGRKLAEKELIHTEERLISRQFKTASIRYRELLEKEPKLLQRVQLGHIASYLGITQVSLSRIRAETK